MGVPSTIFRWNPADFDALLRTCEEDGLLPLIEHHLPRDVPLLEAGCGAGRYVRFLTDRGWDVIGVEWLADTLKMVKARWPDLRVIQGDVAKLPFGDGAFGAVVSLGVIEHWAEGPEGPLLELLRVLRPDGAALITVPCLNAIRRAKRILWWDEISRFPRAAASRILKGKNKQLNRLRGDYRFAVYPTYGPFFEYRFTPDQFRALLTTVGFKVVLHAPLGEMDGLYHELNPLRLLVRFKNWRFYPRAFARWLNQRLSSRPFFHSHMQVVIVKKDLADDR